MTAITIPPPDPRRSRRLRWMTQEQSDQAARFVALPGAASFLTLLSAACLLAGLYGVLAPGLNADEGGPARFAAMGVVALYLGSLLGVVGIMCRWQAGNPDAIGASIVGAVLVVGQAVTLDLIAVDHLRLTAVLAGVGLCAVAGLARIWNRLTGGPVVPGLRVPLMLLLGWDYLGPVAFGLRSMLEIRHPDMTVLHPAGWWLAGTLLVLLAAVLGLRACRRDAGALAAQEPGPLLAGRALRWVLVLVLLAATGIHQYVLGYGASLDLVGSDLAAVLAVLVLIANELRAGLAGGDRLRDSLAVALPALAVVLLLLSGESALTEDMNRGPGAIQTALLSLHPMATLALLSVLALTLWWRSRRCGLLLGAIISSSLLALLAGADGGAVNATAGLGVASLWCLGAAIWGRRPQLALAAMLLAELLALTWSGTRELLADFAVNDLAMVLAALGATVLLFAAWRPAWLQPFAARAAAWATGLGLLGCCLPLDSALYGPAAGGVVLTVVLVGLAWRRGDRWLLGPLSLPTLALLPQLLPDRACWWGIDGAFVLLGGALGVGWRRLRSAPPASDLSAAPRSDSAPMGGVP